ncbi:RCC1 domain-containing protein [Streptomyces sp. NPDC001739]
MVHPSFEQEHTGHSGIDLEQARGLVMAEGDLRSAVFQESAQEVSSPVISWVDVRVKGWGANGSYQLGDNSGMGRTRPGTVPGLTGAYITSLSTGGDGAGTGFGLALLSNGTVDAWGYNALGQLGDGTYTSPRAVPCTVYGLEGVVGIAAGGGHCLALLGNGTVRGWGSNNYCQLGDPSRNNHPTPVAVPGLEGVIAIAAGGNHSLALDNNGTVWTWGNNDAGQLGAGGTIGTPWARATPERVPGLTGVQRIAAGANHSLAVMADQTVRAWGANAYGQLGNNTRNPSSTPVTPVQLGSVTEIIAGASHSVALMSDSTLQTWGYNLWGQLGNGSSGSAAADRLVPGPVNDSLATDITAMAAGNGHTLALRRDGTVLGWGYNNLGQLGDGSTTNRSTPVVVAKENGYPRKVIAAAAGGSHSYAI